MKKFLFFFVTFCFFVNSVLFSLEVYGTKENPIKISSYEDLMELSNLVKAGSNFSGDYFVQTNDIVFPDGIEWIPIGDVIRNCAFSGVYNGNGYVIKNIHCEDDFGGFFALLKGDVINLGIESGSIKGKWIGGIASHGNGKIINCYNKAKLISQERAGGIADNFSGKILFSCNFGELAIDPVFEEVAVVYGICSYNANVIEYCYTNFDNLVSPETFKGNLVNSNFGILESEFCNKLNDYYSDIRNIQQGDDYSILKIKPYIYKNFKLSFSKESISDIYKSSDDNLKKYFNKYRFNGKGTDEDPYCVSNLDDFTLIRDFVNFGEEYEGIHFLQTKDISFPEENYLPIGNVQNNILFKGIYDGGNHKIFNLHSNNPYAGLFSYLGGTVKNLGIESGEVTGDTVGSIASHGNASAKIINCYNKANLFGYSRAGGIADNFYGEIIDCQNFGNISSNNKNAMLDGICSFKNALVTNCNSSGNTVITDNMIYFTLMTIIIFVCINFLFYLFQRKNIQQKTIRKIFFLICINFLAFAIAYIFFSNGMAMKYLFWNGKTQGIFPDFFESVKDSANLTPYNNGSIYPPFAYFLLFIISRFIPQSGNFGIDRLTPNGVIFSFVFFAIISFCILILIRKIANFSRIEFLIFIFIFFFMPAFVFMIERGNIVVLTVAFLLLFIKWYDSKYLVKREIALICLCMATCMKLYPIFFGFFLLSEKKYKEILHCFVYGTILLFLPFSFMGGFERIFDFINNIIHISNSTFSDSKNFGYGYKINVTNIFGAVLEYLKLKDTVPLHVINKVLLVFVLVSSLFITMYSQKKWEKLLGCALMCTLFPTFSYIYNGLYILVPLSIFLTECMDDKKNINFVYALLFAIFCSPFPYRYLLQSLPGQNKLSISTLLDFIVLVAFLILIIIESIVQRKISTKGVQICLK